MGRGTVKYTHTHSWTRWGTERAASSFTQVPGSKRQGSTTFVGATYYFLPTVAYLALLLSPRSSRPQRLRFTIDPPSWLSPRLGLAPKAFLPQAYSPPTRSAAAGVTVWKEFADVLEHLC
ncbi:hypothetical protein GQ53DRAFT_741433 [Thozetella sp. PMI_491]|nr:hypothetical protein GQ53DRAFT_741433 [Thozetella sp. PMI_491]